MPVRVVLARVGTEGRGVRREATSWSVVDATGHEFGAGLRYGHAIGLALAWPGKCEVRNLLTGACTVVRDKKGGGKVVEKKNPALNEINLLRWAP